MPVKDNPKDLPTYPSDNGKNHYRPKASAPFRLTQINQRLYLYPSDTKRMKLNVTNKFKIA